MSLIFYHSVESTCAQKVRFVMAEKGLAWEEKRLNLRKGEQFTPEYLKLNPKAVVPTLVHDSHVIRESSVIAEYLDDAFPEPALRPSNSYDRARMRLLMRAVDDEVHPSVGVLTYAIVLRHQMNELMTPEELERHFRNVADPRRRERQALTHETGLEAPAVEGSVVTLGHVIQQMDDNLDTGPWLAGEDYSLADATATPYMFRLQALSLAGLWQDSRNVGAWLERSVSRSEALSLEDPWGSASFHEVVAKFVDIEMPNIRRLVA